MNLLFHIPSESITETYHKVKRLLQRFDNIIFEAMREVSSTFQLPANQGEFEQKHREIERKLNYTDALGGRELAFQLMSHIYQKIIVNGGVPGLDSDCLLEAISFETNFDNVRLYLTKAVNWCVEWKVGFNFGRATGQGKVILELYGSTWNEIVPSYIVQYVHSAINAYQQGMNAVAIALISIATEGTLRDILASKGYSFDPSASSEDIYQYAKASVSTTQNSYILMFNQNMPKSIADFGLSTGGNQNVEIEIGRKINKRKGRIDLIMKTPSYLLDHFSLDTVLQPAQKRVNGLGEALEIARNREGFLTPDILPMDLDEVLTIVRNNLIHLSGEALNTSLIAYDPAGNFKLNDFLNRSNYVYDLIINVPRFINDQYVQLNNNP